MEGTGNIELRTLLPVVAVLVTGVSGSNVALAGPITLINDGSSITLSFSTSNPSVHGTAMFSLSGGDTLTIVMTNTSTTGAGVGVITGIGWDTTPDTTVNEAGSTIPLLWDYATNGGGMGGFEQRNHVSGGIGNGLNPGASITFAILLNGAPHGSLDIDQTAMHFQEVWPEKSEKPPGYLVPEPSTLLLLGIGIGMASLGFWRKRS